jgi:hypothetical protein
MLPIKQNPKVLNTSDKSTWKSPSRGFRRKMHNHLLDAVGFSTSFICALHCMALPLLFTTGAFSGVVWPGHSLLEAFLILGAVSVAGWSLSRSYLYYHRNRGPLFLGVAGMLTLLLSRLAEDHAEHWITAAGGILIAAAHWYNWKSTRSRKTSFQ